MQYWKKFSNILNTVALIGGLTVPLLIFLNRFLVPDMSFDSINYHVFLGDRWWNFWKYSSAEFYPTGLHSFPTLFDYFGGIFRSVLGYKLGAITSLIFLYGIVFLVFKIISIFSKEKDKTTLLFVLFFLNIFISLEAFFQIATYYVDIIGAFFVVWSLYLWLLYQREKLDRYLYLSSLVMGIAVAGKLTNLIFAVPMILMVLTFEVKNKQELKQKVKKVLILCLMMFVPISLPSVSNFIKTGNPVFPFYNSVFRSKYFPEESFENRNYGGTNIVEKIFWPIYSLKNTKRLGEGHDLYNDYKLNIYFLLLIPSLFLLFKFRKKDRLFWNLNLYFVLSLVLWNFTFGYLRYAYVLEILGGLVLLMWVLKVMANEGKSKRIFLIPIIILLVLFGYLDKRAININLAYDVSWRPTFTYNKVDYLKEYKNFSKNRIEGVKVAQEFRPDIYLNCSSPGLSFYSLSQFNSLPVVNIDSRASGDMTSNKYYVAEVNRRIDIALQNKSPINFVTIVGNHGLSNQYRDCIENLKLKNYEITNEISVDNFLGYSGQKMVVLYGKYETTN